jgi:hypothetical protein
MQLITECLGVSLFFEQTVIKSPIKATKAMKTYYDRDLYASHITLQQIRVYSPPCL